MAQQLSKTAVPSKTKFRGLEPEPEVMMPVQFRKLLPVPRSIAELASSR